MIQVVVGLAVQMNGAVLYAVRGQKADYPGCYEFPGGKLERKESHEKALVREWEEELGVTPTVSPIPGIRDFLGDGFRVKLMLAKIPTGRQPVALSGQSEIGWAPLSDIESKLSTPSTIHFIREMRRLWPTFFGAK